jgi:hypothetical protein
MTFNRFEAWWPTLEQAKPFACRRSRAIPTVRSVILDETILPSLSCTF